MARDEQLFLYEDDEGITVNGIDEPGNTRR